MTEQDKKEYFDVVDDNIKKFGYHLTFVFDNDSPSFCYSTGIYKNFNIPEIFISSLPKNLSFELIENYVNLFKETKSIPINTKVDNLTNRFPIYFIDVSVSSLKDYILSTIRFYKSYEYKYLQIIFPDTQGYFPNDNGYYYDQEIMGEFIN